MGTADALSDLFKKAAGVDKIIEDGPPEFDDDSDDDENIDPETPPNKVPKDDDKLETFICPAELLFGMMIMNCTWRYFISMGMR